MTSFFSICRIEFREKSKEVCAVLAFTCGICHSIVSQINPTVEWSTYFGGAGTEYYEAMDVSGDSIIYVAGLTNSEGLSTTGVHQESLNGSTDVFLTKFSSSGDLLWCTYFGGEEYDWIYGIQVDNNGDVVIAGQTTSTTGISTSGSFQEVSGGSYEAYVAKFSSDGQLIWSTYFGSSGFDQFKDIAIDSNNNIWLVGYSSSSGLGFGDSYQANNIGNGDVLLTKFDEQGQVQYSSYFGGADSDSGQAIAIDIDDNVYIGGGSFSTNGLGTPGAHQISCAGNNDSFYSKFNPSGQLVWSTYFGGFMDNESSSESAIDIQVDNLNNRIVFCGETRAFDGIATEGAFQEDYGGGERDAYFGAWDLNGQLIYASYLGGENWDYAEAIGLTTDGSFWIAGYTQSSNNIATPGTLQEELNVPTTNDAFIAKFGMDYFPIFSSYFGGLEHDGAYCLGIASENGVYMAGGSPSQEGISTPGSFQESLAGGDDAFLTKFFPNLCEQEFCNGLDDDCDNLIDEDFDLDLDSFSLCAGDCDDTNSNVYPGAPELNDGLDNDCDTMVDEDIDQDGDGFTVLNGDCDDSNEMVNPDAVELCNGIDDNCNQSIDEGFDVDGDGYSICAGDCDDGDETINPIVTELCNGIDDNCNELIDEGFDIDGDGFTTCQGDCDDFNNLVFPGALEISDNIDNDCDELVDEENDSDGDGFSIEEGDCNDNNSSINPLANEICNGIDDNCNDQIDELLDCDGNLFIPNGFSPNGDGFNDEWNINGLNTYMEISITVVNRWGQEVFTSNNYSTPWNGTFQGDPLPPMDYFYIILLDNETTITGFVAIKY